MIEYILLLSVVMGLVYTMYKSKYFKNFFGEEGQFAKAFKKEMEFSYRHGLGGRGDNSTVHYTDQKHPTYYNAEKGKSRFFAPKDPYPN